MILFEKRISFVKDEISILALRNFSEPETGFAWSDGRWCEAIFPFDTSACSPGLAVDMVLDLDVFKVPPTLPGQNVLIYVNGLRVSSNFVTRRTTIFSPFDASILKPVENVITVDTPDVIRPQDVGVDDSRRLGIQLFSVQFRKAS